MFPKLNNSPNKKFAKACSHGIVPVVEKYLNHIDPSVNSNKAIRRASLFNHSQIINMLMDDNRVDVSDKNNTVLRNLCHNLNFECLYKLLKGHMNKVDPTVNFNIAIRYASFYGQTKIVRLLLTDKRVNPSDLDDYALIHASKNGYVDVVKLLTKKRNVIANYNQKSLLCAFENNNFDVFEILLRKINIKLSLAAKLLEEASMRQYVEIISMLIIYIWNKSESKSMKYSDNIEKIYPIRSVTKAIFYAILHKNNNIKEIITSNNGYLKYKEHIFEMMPIVKEEYINNFKNHK